MKNIHLLPTDKLSRLYEFGGQFILTHELTDAFRNYHIYITSDEEIKEGDLKDGEYYLYFNKVRQFNKIDNLNRAWKDYKKIILTTDPDLIKDGVQAIDDTFLEWFVKNSSCEYVKIKRIVVYDDNNNGSGEIFHSNRKFAYEIIIPQEESKQERMYSEEDLREAFIAGGNSQIEEDDGYGSRYLKYMEEWFKQFKKNNMEQETLEKFINQFTLSNTLEGLDQFSYDKGLEDGAKWQAERMYSVKEVLNMLPKFAAYTLINADEASRLPLDKWFEQFKKK